MRRYESPEFEIEKFVIQSVFTDSSLDGGDIVDGGDDGFDF